MSKLTSSPDLLTGIIGIARDYVSSEIRVTVETNMLPAVTVYSGAQGAGGGVSGLASALGIRGGVVVRNARGDVLARFGDPVPVSPLRAALVVCAISAAGWLLVKVLR